MSEGSTRVVACDRYNSPDDARACERRVHDTPPPAGSPRAGEPSRRGLCVALIAAIAKNGVIGIDNRLPWKLPEDLRRFRELTTGHAVIMGRRTWQSIGKPLPDRQNIVVTRRRDLQVPGCETAASLAEALTLVRLPDPAFVIGGEALYRAALPVADRLYLTEIGRDFEGDVHFPLLERDHWREISREASRLDEPDGFPYAFAVYERVRTSA
jgi:dihydrofolate reductase